MLFLLLHQSFTETLILEGLRRLLGKKPQRLPLIFDKQVITYWGVTPLPWQTALGTVFII